ncbi:MAG TPA: Ig-like domain-containing domain, partial [Chitinivibrionales bacterium]
MLKKYCFLVLLFYSCARQVAPTGGPDDKTPPTVRYTAPLIATVRYPVKSAITFHFSEWVDKKTAEKCISVFPVPPKGFAIKVSGKSIEVRPVQAFAESTTYHIEVGTSLMDLHGNSIGTPFHFFFSTGPSIDSGKVFGCVVSADGAPIQTKIALFTRLSPVFADTAFFNLPNYLVQADSSGLFTFDHIRKGAYAIVAFIDANNDNRIQPGIEQAFAPVDKFITIDSTVGPIVLYPVASDTITNRIVSISPISNLVVMGTWARIPDSAASIAREQWRIQRVDTPAAKCRIKACVSLPNSSKFLLTLADTLRSAAYRLWYKVPVRLIRGTALASDSIRFTGIRLADTVYPVATGFFPQGAAELKPHIKLVWSKPV